MNMSDGARDIVPFGHDEAGLYYSNEVFYTTISNDDDNNYWIRHKIRLDKWTDSPCDAPTKALQLTAVDATNLTAHDKTDQTTHVYYIDMNQGIRHKWRDPPGGKSQIWHEDPNPTGASSVTNLCTVCGSNGSIHLFYISGNVGDIYHGRLDKDGTYYGDEPCQGPSNVVELAVAKAIDDQLYLFYIDKDGNIGRGQLKQIDNKTYVYNHNGFTGGNHAKRLKLVVGCEALQNTLYPLHVFYIGGNNEIWHGQLLGINDYQGDDNIFQGEKVRDFAAGYGIPYDEQALYFSNSMHLVYIHKDYTLKYYCDGKFVKSLMIGDPDDDPEHCPNRVAIQSQWVGFIGIFCLQQEHQLVWWKSYLAGNGTPPTVGPMEVIQTGYNNPPPHPVP